MTVLHAVLPGGIDDPAAPSGGNAYDRRACRELAAFGWDVRAVLVDGAWPQPDRAACEGLHRALSAVGDGGIVLVDGLVGCAAPEVVVAHARRLHLAVLVHLPLADETGLPPALAADLDARERAVLRAAAAVVVTSAAAAGRLARHGLDGGRVHVAEPGVDRAPLAAGSPTGTALLCVASITPRKAHDVLVEALALLDRPVSCLLAGPLDRAPGHVADLRERIRRHGLDVRLAGPLAGAALDAAYHRADLAVLVSWTETYGMAVTEALARGVPVVVSDAGALPATLGHAPGGGRPGLVVPPGDAVALAEGLRRWCDEPGLRETLRHAARERRAILPGWDETARSLHAVLHRLRPRR